MRRKDELVLRIVGNICVVVDLFLNNRMVMKIGIVMGMFLLGVKRKRDIIKDGVDDMEELLLLVKVVVGFVDYDLE